MKIKLAAALLISPMIAFAVAVPFPALPGPTTLDTVTPDGDVLHTAGYCPHGEDWGATGANPTPFAWLGGHGVRRLAAGGALAPLYLTRHRLYSATLNRFLSADPLGLAGGPNLYAYAEGDPLAYIDPLGLCAEGVLGAAIGGFFEGLGGGLSILANTFSFGATDSLGWTDSASYQGSQYTVSRISSAVARESLITAATLGVGSAARGGSVAAKAAYDGVLAVQSATSGYLIGQGIQQVASGEYESGAVNIVSGGLRVGGSIASAVNAATPNEIMPAVRKIGDTGVNNGTRFSPDASALIDLSKQAKKTGISTADAKTLLEWAKEYNLRSRGPEQHLNRNFKDVHIHIGPVDHISIRP